MSTMSSSSVASAARVELTAISEGSLQALKWLALVLMTGDHVNKYVLHGASAALFDAGRLAMPLFAIILGINLARPPAIGSGATDRTVGRLLATGTVASLPFYLLHGYVLAGLPLNVLFTLAVAAMVIEILQRPIRFRKTAAAAMFVVGGALVEFWWPAVALTLGTWLIVSKGPRHAGGWVAITLGLAGLCAINGNAWALGALPLLAVASAVRMKVPRLRAFFYVYYPLHLAVIAAFVHFVR